MKNLRNQISNIIYVYKIVKKADNNYFFIKILQSICSALLIYPNIIIPGMLIDALIAEEKKTFSILIYVLIIVWLPLVQTFFNSIFSMVLQKKRQLIEKKIQLDFYARVISMDYESFESPGASVTRNHAQRTLYSATIVVDRMEGVISSVINVIVISSIVVTLDYIAIVATLAGVLFNALITRWLDKKNYAFKKKELDENKFISTYSSTLTSSFYVKEIKIYKLSSLLLSKLSGALDKLNSLRFDNNKDHIKSTLLHALVSVVKNIIIYGNIVFKIIYNGLSIGYYTIYLTAVGNLTNAISLLMETCLKLSSMSLDIEDLVRFNELKLKQYESGTVNPDPKGELRFEFKNVYFKYPGTDEYVLKNFNFSFCGKEKICIVGENGSGKSTCIKLLLRMYWVTEGEILLNGISIYEYDYNSYIAMFAPVFQDYSLFPATLKENIILADDFSKTRFNDICSSVGVDTLAKKNDEGYNVQITKALYENGIYPSGGECQKLVLARALYHDSVISILDEPTAALDPISEYNFYRLFYNLAKDRCTLLITHRLSAVQLADKVVVFADGRVVEYGTHKELYEKGGIYTEMFDKQAQFYRNESQH